jgi:hypothetical protein
MDKNFEEKFGKVEAGKTAERTQRWLEWNAIHNIAALGLTQQQLAKNTN